MITKYLIHNEQERAANIYNKGARSTQADANWPTKLQRAVYRDANESGPVKASEDDDSQTRLADGKKEGPSAKHSAKI